MVVKDKKKFRRKMRVVCKIIKHKWKPIQRSFQGFRIKAVCVRCGKVRNLRNDEFYME